MALADRYSYAYEGDHDFSDTYVGAFIDAINSYGLPQETIDKIIGQQFGQPPVATQVGALNQATAGDSTQSISTSTDTTRTGALNQAASTSSAVGNTSSVVSGADTSSVVSGEDTAASGAGNVLSGNILAGASWNSLNPTLGAELTALTGLETFDASVGGATTGETLKQLNDFTSAGGTFAPGSTVFLQTGGLDLVYGENKDVIESNLDQIVSNLEKQGVNVVLTGSPYAKSFDAVVSNDFDPALDSIYTNVASRHSNVALVDSMGEILQDKSLLSDFIHPNDAGWKIYNESVIAAYQSLSPIQKVAVTNKVAVTGSSDPESLAKAIDEVAGTDVSGEATKAANSVTSNFGGKTYDLAAEDVNKVKNQILGQNTTAYWSGEGFGSVDANAEAMAKNLVASGVTDISQVGQKTEVIPGYTYETESGTETVPERTVTQLINKVTGEVLINDYGERGGYGDTWSGTYEGKGNTAFRTAFDARGRPIFYTTGASSSDVGDLAPLLAIAQFIPGVAPFAMAANAAIAIDQGDVLGGLASMAGLGGFSDVATGLRVAKAIDQGDMGALAMSLLQNDTVGKMAGSTMLTDTISLADAGNAYNVVTNVQNGNYAGALNSLGTLTDSADTKTAGAAVNLITALNSGNEVAIINAAAGLNNTINAANKLSDASVAKTITSSVTDGANAFVAAKEAGATDAEALSAANTVTGTGTDTSVSTTKNTQVTDSRAQNTLNLSNTDADTLDEAAALAISKGNDSFTIGGKTYIVNAATGNLPADEKQAVDTKLVNEYVRSLGKTNVSELSTEEQNKFLNSYDKFTANGTGVLKAATLADVLTGNSTYSAAESFENSKYTDPFKVEVTGVGSRGDAATDTKTTTPTAAEKLDTAGGDLVNWANTLEGTSGDVVRQTLSTLIGAGGEQVADLGTALANMGVAERYNVLVQLGQSLERTGQKLEIPGVTKATENFWNDIQGAETYAGKAAASIKSVLENPLVLTQVAKEGFQEVLPIVTGGAVFKILGKAAGIGADVLMNASESMGSQSRQKFNEEIAKGTPVEQAEKLANADGWKAFAITATTGGIADASLVKGYEKAMEKVFGKTASAFGKEWKEEGFEELAIALATGDDLATAMSKSIAGSTIGSKTSGSLTAGSSVSADIQQAFASEGLTSTDGTFRPETIRSIDSGTTGTAGSVNTSVTEVANSGTATTGADTAATAATATAGADTAVATDFASIFESTGNTTQAVDTSVGTAISNGANVDSTISSVVNAANSTGASASVVAATAANAAVAAGADVTTASNAATTAVSNATSSTGTATGSTTAADTGTATGSTTAADTGTATGSTTSGNTNTASDANSNTSTNAATGVTTSTTTDSNSGVTSTTATDANSGTSTTVTSDANTGTSTTSVSNSNSGVDTSTTTGTTGTTTSTVVDTNTGSTTTVNVNTDTGEVISVDGPGKVIDSVTVVVDGTPIDVTTGEILTPEQVEQRVTAAKTKLATPSRKTPSLMTGVSPNEPTYAAKDSDIAETWLGGLFRNIAPLAGLGALLPENTPMFQESQALSALRRASGVEEAKTPEADYYAYGSEPSYSKVLEPFMRGGTVQNHADGGKIMASPLMAASGGDVPHKGSHYVQGAGGGQDDLIPAKLADGEYVFDAEIVAALGDGSNKEGAKKLDAMREAIRKHKRGGSLKSIPPKAKSPLAYLKGAL